MTLRLFTLSFALWPICLLVGCNPKMSPEEREEMYEYEIVTQTIRELAEFKIIPPPPPPPPDSSVEGSVETNNRLLDLRTREFRIFKDTATFLIAIFDSFTEPSEFSHGGFYHNTYRGLKSQLLSGAKKAMPLDKKRIGDIRPWKIVERQFAEGWRRCGYEEYLGEISYSRMAFNETFNLALFTYEYTFCSQGGIVLAKREKGKWGIIKHHQSNAH